MDLDKAITQAVKNSISIAGVLRSIGRAYVGSNYKFIRRKIAELCLDTSHFKGVAHGTRPQIMVSWEKVLVENSPFTIGVERKRRLIADGLLKNECYVCGLPPVWKGIPLALELDHKNGIHADNRIANLRLLCPNCHSQTETYCGRNTRRYGFKKPCPMCDAPILRRSRTCHKCSLAARVTKIVWPSPEKVILMLQSEPVTTTAKKLGVSDNAIRKFLKRRAGLTSTMIRGLRLRGREVEGGGL